MRIGLLSSVQPGAAENPVWGKGLHGSSGNRSPVFAFANGPNSLFKGTCSSLAAQTTNDDNCGIN